VSVPLSALEVGTTPPPPSHPTPLLQASVLHVYPRIQRGGHTAGEGGSQIFGRQSLDFCLYTLWVMPFVRRYKSDFFIFNSKPVFFLSALSKEKKVWYHGASTLTKKNSLSASDLLTCNRVLGLKKELPSAKVTWLIS
jgi:hypothetical protein